MGFVEKCGLQHPCAETHLWHLVQVPFRRIALTNGRHFDVYDTSGPQVCIPCIPCHKCRLGS
jgi:hypothetical protein